MPKPLRKKLARMTILIYWPALFLMTHLPLPRVVHEAHLSDKSLHFLAYFILVVLLWSTVRPYDKVHWQKTIVWIVLAVMISYGAMDEWLQHWVRGRTADRLDFYCDLAGAVAGLLLLSTLPFPPVLLFTAALTIFLTTGCSKAELIERWPIARFSFYFLAYAGFTLLWLWYLCRGYLCRGYLCRWFMYLATHKQGSGTSSHPQFNGLKWLILGMALPTLLLVCVKIGTVILGRRFVVQDMETSALGIICTLGAFLFVRKLGTAKSLPDIIQEKT